MVARSCRSRRPEPGPCAVHERAGINWGSELDGRFSSFPAFGLADVERPPRLSGKSEVKAMNTTLITKALYCGLEVEIICHMNHCSLVRFSERSFVVDTTDLVLEQHFKKTAKRVNSAWAA